jgi:putative ABC transport system permease protein
MFFRILVSSFRRSRRRKTVAFAALAIASAIWTLVLAVGAGLGDRARRDLTAYGANIVVFPETAQTAPSVLGVALPSPPAPQTLPESSLSAFTEIFWKHNIAAVSPVLEFPAKADGRAVAAEGVDFRRERPMASGERLVTGVLSAHPAWALVAGRWPQEGRAEAVVGARLARERGWETGRLLNLEAAGASRPIAVTGVFRSGEREDGEILLPLDVAQPVAGLPQRVGRIDVLALTTPESALLTALHRDPRTLSPVEYDRWYCTPYASSIAHQIAEAIAGSRAASVRRVTAAEERSAHVAETLLLFAAGAALVAALLAVFSTLYDSVTERTAEIGLWKALGAEPEKVAAVFLAEAAVNGLLGGLAGALVGSLLAPGASRAIFGFGVERSPLLAAVAACAAVGVSVAAALLPVRRALAIEPISALRGA